MGADGETPAKSPPQLVTLDRALKLVQRNKNPIFLSLLIVCSVVTLLFLISEQCWLNSPL